MSLPEIDPTVRDQFIGQFTCTITRTDPQYLWGEVSFGETSFGGEGYELDFGFTSDASFDGREDLPYELTEKVKAAGAQIPSEWLGLYKGEEAFDDEPAVADYAIYGALMHLVETQLEAVAGEIEFFTPESRFG